MRQEILICDRDKAYVEALASYIISQGADMSITVYSNTDSFLKDKKDYSLALLGWDFMEITDRERKRSLKDIIYLAENMDDGIEGVETLYKFQQMSAFKSRIMHISDQGGEEKRLCGGWQGIMSPCRHELTGVFAMAYAMRLAKRNEKDEVLLLDLEANSALADVLEDDSAKTVTDYIYLLEGGSTPVDALSSCFSYYEGVIYLAAARYFGEIIGITPDMWEKFFNSIRELNYSRVVVVFDEAMRGIKPLLDNMGRLLLIEKEGDYYRKFERQIRCEMDSHKGNCSVGTVNLPLSGANLTDGSYIAVQLMSGNLGKYATEAMEAQTYG